MDCVYIITYFQKLSIIICFGLKDECSNCLFVFFFFLSLNVLTNLWLYFTFINFYQFVIVKILLIYIWLLKYWFIIISPFGILLRHFVLLKHHRHIARKCLFKLKVLMTIEGGVSFSLAHLQQNSLNLYHLDLTIT